MKIRITATWDYEPDPVHYGTEDPVDMLEIDLAGYRSMQLGEYLNEQVTITGEVIE